MTIWLMMLHHHTVFGNNSENIIWTGQTFTDISNLCCDLDLESSHPIFQQDTLAYDALLSNQVWLQTDQQFRRYSRNNHILINISPHCDLDTEHSEPIFLHGTLAYDAAHPYQVWKQNVL